MAEKRAAPALVYSPRPAVRPGGIGNIPGDRGLQPGHAAAESADRTGCAKQRGAGHGLGDASPGLFDGRLPDHPALAGADPNKRVGR